MAAERHLEADRLSSGEVMLSRGVSMLRVGSRLEGWRRWARESQTGHGQTWRVSSLWRSCFMRPHQPLPSRSLSPLSFSNTSHQLPPLSLRHPPESLLLDTPPAVSCLHLHRIFLLLYHPNTPYHAIAGRPSILTLVVDSPLYPSHTRFSPRPLNQLSRLVAASFD